MARTKQVSEKKQNSSTGDVQSERVVTKKTTLVSGFPGENYALKWCSILLTFGAQTFHLPLVQELIHDVGIQNLTEAKKKTRAAFSKAKKLALFARAEYGTDKKEIGRTILNGGMRHLHPSMFDEFGYHKLLADPSISKRFADERFQDTFRLYVLDTMKYPDNRGLKEEDDEDTIPVVHEEEDEYIQPNANGKRARDVDADDDDDDIRQKKKKSKTVAEDIDDDLFNLPDSQESEHAIEPVSPIPDNSLMGQAAQAATSEQKKKSTAKKPASAKSAPKKTSAKKSVPAKGTKNV